MEACRRCMVWYFGEIERRRWFCRKSRKGNLSLSLSLSLSVFSKRENSWIYIKDTHMGGLAYCNGYQQNTIMQLGKILSKLSIHQNICYYLTFYLIQRKGKKLYYYEYYIKILKTCLQHFHYLFSFLNPVISNKH